MNQSNARPSQAQATTTASSQVRRDEILNEVFTIDVLATERWSAKARW